jgi:hypothetical protein
VARGAEIGTVDLQQKPAWWIASYSVFMASAMASI